MIRDTPRARLVLVLLLLVALALLTVDVRDPASSPLRRARAWAGSIFGPAEAATAAAVRPVRGVLDSVQGLGRSSQRIEELEREKATLQLQLRASGVDRRRVEELDRLLGVTGLGQFRVVPARVVAFGPAQGFSHTATVDAGERDGLRPDMTVLNGDGLVGRVKAVTRTTATVVLVTDPSSSVGVRMENGKLGVAQGGGAQPLQVDLFDPTAAVAAGDRLVSVGSQAGAPFVPGVPVGEVLDVRGVTSSLTKRTLVRPYVDFGALDLVGVVVEPPERDPRDTLLAPRPAASTAAPTPSPTPSPSADAGQPGPSPSPSPSPSPKAKSSAKPSSDQESGSSRKPRASSAGKAAQR